MHIGLLILIADADLFFSDFAFLMAQMDQMFYW